MKTIYRKVKDRNPQHAGMYFVIDKHGAKFADRWSGKGWYSRGIHTIVYWLEEIQLPTEEEIDKEATRMLKEHWCSEDEASEMTDDKIIKMFFDEWCLACDVAKNVLSKLK